jgi:hypothetical protein
MLPLKKIYIDSRDRTPDSRSASNFKIELPQTVQMPDNTVFYVTDVCIPNVWKTIEENFNDKLYLFYHTPQGTLPVQLPLRNDHYKVVTIPEGNYTLTSLASKLQELLNNALNATAKIFTTFVVTPDAVNNSITISMSGSSSTVWFYFLTDRQVSLEVNKSILWTDLNGNTYSIDRNNPQSANDILKFTSPMDITTSVNTGFLNLSHINNVYITSPNLGSFDTIATFSNNIIKQVPVTSSYGVMVVDQFISTNDYLNCSRQTLRTLEFHLRDGRGREIDLKGMYVTFSIVFNKYNLEM